MAQRYPPAWYPDPHHPERIRRWDGRSWTSEWRPRPSWLRPLDLAPGPPATAASDRTVLARRLWAASTIALATALLLLLSLSSSLSSTAASSERIDDATFLTAAAEQCARLRPYTSRTATDRAAMVRSVEEVVDELRALPVADGDAPEVASWLASWDAWTAAFHRHAEAEAARDDDGMRAIEQETIRVRTAINRFAYANGLSDCVL